MFFFDSFKVCQMFIVNGKEYIYYFFDVVVENGFGDVLKFLVFLKVLFENMLCNEDGMMVIWDDVIVFKIWIDNGGKVIQEIVYCLVCVLMQDFIGVLVVVDLVVMCDVVEKFGVSVEVINL